MPSGTQRLRNLGTLIFACLLSNACADEELAVVASSIDVCIDAQLDTCGTNFALGPIRAGRGLEIPLYIANRGSGDLSISAVEVVEGPVEIVRYPATVESGAARITLTGWDVDLGVGSAILRFLSNDPEKPTLDVQLSFEGVESVIVVCPAEAESLADERCGGSVMTSLEDVRRGDTRVFQVWVGNIGLAPLQVFGAQVEGRSSVAGEFSLRIIRPQAQQREQRRHEDARNQNPAVATTELLAQTEGQRPQSARDHHRRHVHAADRPEVQPPVKAREHNPGQAHESATRNAVADDIRRHTSRLVEEQHPERGRQAADVHHQQKPLQAQSRVDRPEDKVGQHARRRDGHKERQDSFVRKLIL